MNKELLKRISHIAQKISIPKDVVIFNEGDICEKFIVLLEGSVKVFKTSEKGQEITLYRVTTENLCVLTTSCILGSSQYPAIGKTETEVLAISLEKINFDKLITEDIEFRELVFRSLANRFSNFVKKIDEITFLGIKDRLIKFLEEGKDHNGIIKKTHQEIALELGVERETISRGLKALDRAGVVELERGKIKLLM